MSRLETMYSARTPFKTFESSKGIFFEAWKKNSIYTMSVVSNLRSRERVHPQNSLMRPAVWIDMGPRTGWLTMPMFVSWGEMAMLGYVPGDGECERSLCCAQIIARCD